MKAFRPMALLSCLFFFISCEEKKPIPTSETSPEEKNVSDTQKNPKDSITDPTVPDQEEPPPEKTPEEPANEPEPPNEPEIPEYKPQNRIRPPGAQPPPPSRGDTNPNQPGTRPPQLDLEKTFDPCRIEFDWETVNRVFCNGKDYGSMFNIKSDSRNQLQNVSFAQIQNESKDRSIFIGQNGQLTFVASDSTVSQRLSQSVRMMQVYFFPRKYEISISKNTASDEFVLQDPSGTLWTLELVASNLPKFPNGQPSGPEKTFRIKSIGDQTQIFQPISLDEKGIIGADLSRVKVLRLFHNRGSTSGAVNVKNSTYLNLKSKFVDPKGNTCEKSNRLLFTPIDSTDDKLKFATDSDLIDFLDSQCPNLDIRSLG